MKKRSRSNDHLMRRGQWMRTLVSLSLAVVLSLSPAAFQLGGYFSAYAEENECNDCLTEDAKSSDSVTDAETIINTGFREMDSKCVEPAAGDEADKEENKKAEDKAEDKAEKKAEEKAEDKAEDKAEEKTEEESDKDTDPATNLVTDSEAELEADTKTGDTAVAEVQETGLKGTDVRKVGTEKKKKDAKITARIVTDDRVKYKTSDEFLPSTELTVNAGTAKLFFNDDDLLDTDASTMDALCEVLYYLAYKKNPVPDDITNYEIKEIKEALEKTAKSTYGYYVDGLFGYDGYSVGSYGDANYKYYGWMNILKDDGPSFPAPLDDNDDWVLYFGEMNDHVGFFDEETYCLDATDPVEVEVSEVYCGSDWNYKRQPLKVGKLTATLKSDQRVKKVFDIKDGKAYVTGLAKGTYNLLAETDEENVHLISPKAELVVNKQKNDVIISARIVIDDRKNYNITKELLPATRLTVNAGTAKLFFKDEELDTSAHTLDALCEVLYYYEYKKDPELSDFTEEVITKIKNNLGTTAKSSYGGYYADGLLNYTGYSVGNYGDADYQYYGWMNILYNNGPSFPYPLDSDNEWVLYFGEMNDHVGFFDEETYCLDLHENDSMIVEVSEVYCDSDWLYHNNSLANGTLTATLKTDSSSKKTFEIKDGKAVISGLVKGTYILTAETGEEGVHLVSPRAELAARDTGFDYYAAIESYYKTKGCKNDADNDIAPFWEMLAMRSLGMNPKTETDYTKVDYTSLTAIVLSKYIMAMVNDGVDPASVRSGDLNVIQLLESWENASGKFVNPKKPNAYEQQAFPLIALAIVDRPVSSKALAYLASLQATNGSIGWDDAGVTAWSLMAAAMNNYNLPGIEKAITYINSKYSAAITEKDTCTLAGIISWKFFNDNFDESEITLLQRFFDQESKMFVERNAGADAYSTNYCCVTMGEYRSRKNVFKQLDELYNGYSISYTLNGGAITGYKPESYKKGTGAALPTAVTRSNYTFSGWYTTANFTGSKVTAVTASDSGNKIFYAKWTSSGSSSGRGGSGGGGGGGGGQGAVAKGYSGGNAVSTLPPFAQQQQQQQTATTGTPMANSTPAASIGSAEAPVAPAWNYNALTGKYSLGSAGMEVKNSWAYVKNPNAAEGQPNGDLFFFDENGIMLTGWQWIKCQDGKYRCYYFNPNAGSDQGKCQMSGTTSDGYTLGQGGAWVVNGVEQTK